MMINSQHKSFQKEIPIFQEILPPVFLDWEEVQNCESEQAAFLLSLQQRRDRSMSYSTIAETLEIDKAQFSRIVSGIHYLPTNKRNHFMQLVGNKALMQYDLIRNGDHKYFIKQPDLFDEQQREAS